MYPALFVARSAVSYSYHDDVFEVGVLLQFPSVPFERRLIPFLRTVEEAREVREDLDAAMDGEIAPLVFLTVVDESVREELLRTRAPVIDFVSGHLAQLEAQLGVTGDHAPARLHGVGDSRRYNRRMQAVEFAIEHDDGQSLRALDRAQVVLIAPSRCGKTPTCIYMAMQYGVFAANYPLTDEDLERNRLPGFLLEHKAKLHGLVSQPERLSQVRNERRPGSRYASLQQASWELRQAEMLFRQQGIPYLDSTSMSIEEMSALIMQEKRLRRQQG